MRHDHDPDGESPETELVGVHDFACPANRTAPVTETELSRNDENVVFFLLVTELLERLGRLLRLTEILRTELTFTIIVEHTVLGLHDQVENLLHGFAVCRGDLLPPRNGEPSFGIWGKTLLGQLLIGVANPGEQLAQPVGLLGDSLGLVAGEVAVVGFCFLVYELIAYGEFTDGRHDHCLEFVAVFDELLKPVLVETRFLERTFGGTLDEPEVLLFLSFGDAGVGDRCFHRHPPSFLNSRSRSGQRLASL